MRYIITWFEGGFTAGYATFIHEEDALSMCKGLVEKHLEFHFKVENSYEQ